MSGSGRFPYQPPSINSSKSGQQRPLSLTSPKGSPLIRGNRRHQQWAALMLCPPVKSLADNGQVFRLLTSVWKVDFFICCVLFHLKKKKHSLLIQPLVVAD